MASARELALRSLLRWHRREEPPLLPERTEAAWAALDARDRAFGYDLVTGVMRWRGCLEAVIASRLRQPLATVDHAVQAILWVGAYQLLIQGGTADYAAVSETVELAAKNRSTARTGGLVNAALRAITRMNPKRMEGVDGAALSRRGFGLDFQTRMELAVNVFADPSAMDTHLAAARSHPAELVKHLRGFMDDAKTSALLLRNNVRPAITLRVDGDALDAPAEAGLAAHGEAKRFVVAAAGWNARIEELVKRGALSPQDPTAAKPVRFVGEHLARKMPARVLDLCAGLGTKTLQLARVFSDATVVATDVDAQKLAKLSARMKEVGQKNVTVVSTREATEGKKYDVVLVDVPCSNTGVMARRVQSRWRWPTLDHGSLHSLQTNLLRQGAATTAAGGVVIYSTCSIDPAENEKIVGNFMRQGTGVQLVHDELTLPDFTGKSESAHDGGYFAVMSVR